MIQTEKELVNLLTFNLQKKFEDRKIAIFKEISVGYGIADMVVSVVNEEKQEDRKGVNSLTEKEVHTYTVLENERWLTFAELRNITRIGKYQLTSSLSNLKEKGFIEENRGEYQISKEFDLIFDFNFAIEAKLRNWKRALHQAYRYRWFSEYAYVVLDHHYSAPAIAQLDLFKKFNVGLASIDSAGEIFRHYHPVRKVPFDIRMQRLFSEKMRSELSNIT